MFNFITGEYVVTNNIKSGEANFQRWEFIPVETPLQQSSDEVTYDIPEGQRLNSSNVCSGVECDGSKTYTRKRLVQPLGGQPKT